MGDVPDKWRSWLLRWSRKRTTIVSWTCLGSVSGNAIGVTTGWQPRIAFSLSSTWKSSQQTGQHNFETETISLAKLWEVMNEKFHIQAHCKTKYLGKISQSAVGLWLGVRVPLQKRRYHRLAVHVQGVGFQLSFHHTPEIVQKANGLWRQPLPAGNFLAQVSDNLALFQVRGALQGIPYNIFEFFPSWHSIKFTAHCENFNFRSLVLKRGESSSVDFQVSLAEKVGHKRPNPSKEHLELWLVTTHRLQWGIIDFKLTSTNRLGLFTVAILEPFSGHFQTHFWVIFEYLAEEQTKGS